MLVESGNPAHSLADSFDDWSPTGNQSEKNWFYGYYNRTTDTAVPGYQPGDFIQFRKFRSVPRHPSTFRFDLFKDKDTGHRYHGKDA